jgi:hypothetical protein
MSHSPRWLDAKYLLVKRARLLKLRASLWALLAFVSVPLAWSAESCERRLRTA